MKSINNSKEIIESATAIVTISGTAAWEGFGKGKPAIFFGTHPAMVYKYAYRVRNKFDLINVCEEILKRNSRFSEEKDIDLKIFFDFLKKHTININFYKTFPHSTINAKESAQNYIYTIKKMHLKEC